MSTKTRFEEETEGNLEMAYWFSNRFLSLSRLALSLVFETVTLGSGCVLDPYTGTDDSSGTTFSKASSQFTRSVCKR